MPNNKNIYFLGIGGIGMSALAEYFILKGYSIFGYDSTPSKITDALIKKGAKIHFIQDISQIPNQLEKVIYTAAIKSDNIELKYFRDNNIKLYKRAEILGLISKTKNCIAIAGTHGKTTTTATTAFLIDKKMPVNAFIGGIAINFNTNIIYQQDAETTVVEADEFDRSFLFIYPTIGIITSIDADHLDIYKDKNDIIDSFQQFSNNIDRKGKLIIHEKVAHLIDFPNKIIYGESANSDCFPSEVKYFPNKIEFNLNIRNSDKKIEKYTNLVLGISGKFNLSNAIAASVATRELFKMNNYNFHNEIFNKLKDFKGVKRRFEYRIFDKNLIYIDDYAHHPEAIKSLYYSVRELFPNKKITGVFQPHLYSRTQDLSDEFAKALELFDEIILLDIYPAREKPIEGVTSAWLLSLINNPKKIVLKKEDLINFLKKSKLEVLLTIGAGNIDMMVSEIEKKLK